jgi:hypothetical protein
VETGLSDEFDSLNIIGGAGGAGLNGDNFGSSTFYSSGGAGGSASVSGGAVIVTDDTNIQGGRGGYAGNATSAYANGTSGNSSGRGGKGGDVSVALTSLSSNNIIITGGNGSRASSGGNGSNGFSNDTRGGAGGYGGNGGDGGAVTIRIEGDISASGSLILSSGNGTSGGHGGAGGHGGNNADSTINGGAGGVGNSGGVGGDGGAVSLSASYLSADTLNVISGNGGSPGVGRNGGNGGHSYASASGGKGGIGGDGGDGGNAGAVTLKADTITANNINIKSGWGSGASAAGAGGNGGVGANNTYTDMNFVGYAGAGGVGGNGANGGSGGDIRVSAVDIITDNLTVTASAGGKGGNGANGGNGGNAGDYTTYHGFTTIRIDGRDGGDGGDGANGGDGGDDGDIKITTEILNAGSISLTAGNGGGNGVGGNGGNGGNGGDGYNQNANGGNGGVGGNGGNGGNGGDGGSVSLTAASVTTNSITLQSGYAGAVSTTSGTDGKKGADGADPYKGTGGNGGVKGTNGVRGEAGNVSFTTNYLNAESINLVKRDGTLSFNAGTMHIYGNNTVHLQNIPKGAVKIDKFLFELSGKANGTTMLTFDGSNSNVSLSNSNIGLRIENGSPMFGEGYTIILIDVNPSSTLSIFENTSLNNTTIFAKQGSLIIYLFDVNQTNRTLTITAASGAIINPQTSSLAQGYIGGVISALRGQDLIADLIINNAVYIAQTAGDIAPFSIVSKDTLRYDANSYIDVDTWHLVTGVAFDTDLDDLYGNSFSSGVFFEGGKGEYDTFANFDKTFASVKSRGDITYYGLGAFVRFGFEPSTIGRFYIETAIRGGELKNSFHSHDLTDSEDNGAEYGIKGFYYGAHLGAGYIFNITDSTTLELYGKYLYSYQQGDTDTLNTGESVEFSDVASSRARGGLKLLFGSGDYFKPSIGVSYEREFDGESQAFAQDFKLKTPELAGETFIGEIDLSINPTRESPMFFGFNIKGYLGQKEGMSGTLKIEYGF